MDGLKEFENWSETEIIEMPPQKGHYETVKEYTKEVPIYDEEGRAAGAQTVVTGRERKWVWDAEDEAQKQKTQERVTALKAELVKVMEDIEQEQLGLVRDDYTEKKARAAEIINELRVLEGKEPRAVSSLHY